MRTRMVDFYLYSTHEVAVWEPIWFALRQSGVDAQFVLEAPGVHRAMGSVPDPNRGWVDDKDGDVVPLVDDATYRTLHALMSERGLPHIDHSRVHADAVVTTQGIGWLGHYRGLKIKTEYGASAFVDVYGHGPINQGLDAVLTHGPFSTRAISAHLPHDRLLCVGYPKWAPQRRQGLDREAARDMLGLAADRPVVAWVPTWAHNASIDDYSAEMAALGADYEVVVKPHHNTLRFEAERLNKLRATMTVADNLHSIVPLIVAADVVVADGRSGCLAEAILADRPAVGLLPGITSSAHGIVAGLDEAVVFCSSPARLATSVSDALTTDRTIGRRRWRDWLFADLGGNDDESAAAAIVELIERDNRRPTTGMGLQRLDELIDACPSDDAAGALSLLERTWPLWPGHPRLIAMVEQISRTASSAQLVACARLVRLTHGQTHCPVSRLVADGEQDPLSRLVAAAIATSEFSDPGADEVFLGVAPLVAPDRFGDALQQLGTTPDALPAFVQSAATTPQRCTQLAVALEELGAHEQAAALAAYGESLVLQ